MNSFQIKPLLQVLHYIDAHLNDDLSLQTLAAIGNYSPFHFHRLFKAYTSETINEYVTRKRLEKIAQQLILNKDARIIDLADTYGFSGHSAFSKAFKKHYQLSASELKRLSKSRYDKIILSKNGLHLQTPQDYLCHIKNTLNYLDMNATVHVKNMPSFTMAYVNQIGVDGIENAFAQLLAWAAPNKLVNPENTELIRVYHDSFKVTTPDKVRMEIGVAANENLYRPEHIQLRTFEPGLIVTAHFEMPPSDFEKAWSAMFLWVNENGYKTREQKPFEIIRNNFNEHPEKKIIVDLCIPVEK